MNEDKEIRVVKFWDYGHYICAMLSTAECVYFHKFGKDVYTELGKDSELKKSMFADLKEDIKKQDWNVEILTKNWVKKWKEQ